MTYSISLAELCRFFGITRQAYYKHQAVVREAENQQMAMREILSAVHRLRARMPRLGARKLLHCLSELEPALVQGVGRDAFLNLLRDEQLLIRKRKGFRTRTTDSRHSFRKYPDLYNHRRSEFTSPLMAIVADITYIHTLEGFGYAALLTDVASRMVVGFDLSDSLCVEGSLRAAQMMTGFVEQCAKRGYTAPSATIHHSDRGVQYCSADYIRLLNNHKILPSMTQNGEPTDNALAERINGIFKEEFLFNTTFPTIKAAREVLRQSVQIYNNERPHLALNMKTPQQFCDTFFRALGR